MATIFKKIVSILLLVGCVCLQNNNVWAKERFDGHEVVRTYPSTKEQMEKLGELRDTIDFWTEPRLHGPTDIRLTPSDKKFVRQYLNEHGIRHEVFIPDLQQAVDHEELSQVRSAPGTMDWTSYKSVDEIHDWLTEMEKNYMDIVKVYNIGTSSEGRDLRVVRIGYPPSDGSSVRALFAEGGMHAREWIGPAVVTWFINELCTNRAKNEDLLREVNFYFMPVANPDGYEYSKTNRMWRKTRSYNGNNNPSCFGADPNRNFDAKWGGLGTSSNKCSEIYTGPDPFSEPETRAIRDFVQNQTEADWRVYTAIHSYAQMCLTPYGYDDVEPDNSQDIIDLGTTCCDELTAVHGTKYDVGPVTKLLSPGAGGSDDWFRMKMVKYSYTMEVRDTGDYGFLLPPDQIIPCAEETWAAMRCFARSMKDLPSFNDEMK